VASGLQITAFAGREPNFDTPHAVDAASPGDTVIAPPGRYHESVRIAESGITIRASRGAILDASGFSVGIRATAGPGGPGCAPPMLNDITIDGLRIENASFTGANDEYAIFPICSRNGTIEGNHVEGTDDAAIYIGNSHDVAVERNHATDSTVGIEIENSTGVVVRGNTAIGNTSGIVSFVLPGLAGPVTEDILVERNVVMRNNRPNPVLPSEDVVGLIGRHRHPDRRRRSRHRARQPRCRQRQRRCRRHGAPVPQPGPARRPIP